MSETLQDAKTLLDEAAADPSLDPLMQRCPDDATEEDIRRMVRMERAARATWKAKE